MHNSTLKPDTERRQEIAFKLMRQHNKAKRDTVLLYIISWLKKYADFGQKKTGEELKKNVFSGE